MTKIDVIGAGPGGYEAAIIAAQRGADVDGVTPTATKITVFTTRADTIYGCTFMLLPPESSLAAELVADTEYEAAFTDLKEAATKVTSIERQGTDREKHGVFTGRYALNPVTGESVPIWVSDYVLLDYGTGAVMGVPAGDKRDFDFAKKYDLPIVPIICDTYDGGDGLYQQGVFMEIFIGIRDNTRQLALDVG